MNLLSRRPWRTNRTADGRLQRNIGGQSFFSPGFHLVSLLVLEVSLDGEVSVYVSARTDAVDEVQRAAMSRRSRGQLADAEVQNPYGWRLTASTATV